MKRLQKISELRDYLNDLRNLGASLKEDFSIFEKAVSQEKFPEDKLLGIIKTKFLDWIYITDECSEIYEELFEDDKPRTFSDLEKILDSEEKKIVEANLFGQAEKFLYFVADNPNFQELLTKYQKALKPLLKKKSRDSKTKAAVELYAKFVDAFNEVDTVKKYSASLEFNQTFAYEFIAPALFGNALRFKDDNEIDSPPPEIIDKPPDKEEDFAKILHEKDVFLADADFDDWRESFEIISKRKTELTIKHLKKDFKDIPKEVKSVLLYASLNHCFSIDLLCIDKKFSVDNMEKAAEILLNKGYIQKYSFGKLNDFYTITKEFFLLLKDNSKEVSKILKLSSGDIGKQSSGDMKKQISNDTEFLDDDIKYALPRSVFFRLGTIEFANKNKLSAYGFSSQSFQGIFESNKQTDLILGYFYSDDAEGVHSLKVLRNTLQGEESLNRVIIAGFDASYVNKIFDALEVTLSKDFPKESALYVWSLKDETFYPRNSTEAISPEKIWTESSPYDKSLAKKSATKKSADKESVAKNSIEETFIEKTPAKEIPVEEITIEETFLDEPQIDELRPFNKMLGAKKFYCATAYLKALSLQDENYEPLYRQLAYAINDPLLSISYDSSKINSLLNENETPDENFLTAATLRTFFYNHKQFDYGMKQLHERIKNFALVEQNQPLAELIFALMNFKEKTEKGADYYADYRVKNRSQAENKIAKLRRDARDCLDRIKNLKEKANNPRFIEMKKALFSEGELANYLEYAAENILDKDILEQMKTYLQDTFIKDDSALSIENISKSKLEDIIDEAWEKAGNKVRRKERTKIFGELLNNITTFLKRAIEILCEYVNCFEESAPLQSDEGAIEYKKIRTNLIENVEDAQKILVGKKIANATVLIETLQEIKDKLEGTFESVGQKYFYVDFLRGDKVLLEENYLPNFSFNTLDGTNTSIAERIIEHSRAVLPTFEERIKDTFENRGWDFGTAQLIDAYLEEINGKSYIAQSKYNLKDSENAVKKNALKGKKDFFGFLELAQNYGQFEAAPAKNNKEKILKLIDRCFELAQKTNNLGVFFRVKEYWENKTKEDAAKLAPAINRDLDIAIENYCLRTNEPADSPALQKNIERIRRLIEQQNFTVAQGRINRLSEGNLYNESDLPTEQSHLQYFLDDYETYYKPVRKSGVSFKMLVGNKKFAKAATAKAIKGGEILTENWLPNGFPQNGDVGEDKLEKLLNALGFKVKKVTKTSSINKDALNYKVELLPPLNGQSSNYNHPISAFGSEAEINGFRVTCIFGSYSADGLIARFKEIGNAENTLVLLDYALELPTRRSLARKIKAESGITKIFAVIDRVLMMYLVKNYDNMQINKVLMSLIMPFAACQPYVFNPNVPIPPEIFIGREKEMQKVLDFNGVNIVYGGRQLGKTALLMMACASLDRNENNDRAVFVDINKCDCAAAALKISQTLHAKEFFDDTFADTDDWSQLAANIKKRLASDKPNKIPRFMLALDEADDFIKSCREIDFKPVLELMDIQQQRHNDSRFKFVMAGLRDVVRFYREDSLGNNSQISKLPSLAVKPFALEDAEKLLKDPLRCLGLYFSDDENSDSLAMMILETTNYFPGLIQLYCAKLIDALSKNDYASYKETDSPIYEIKEGHIQSVLGEESFNEEIKNKVDMTLRLGDDKYYYVLAKLIAWIYYNDDKNLEGYSAKDILNTATDFGLEHLLPKSVDQVEVLLKELCELNILRESDKGKYLFVRQRFLNIIGTLEEIEAEMETGFSET